MRYRHQVRPFANLSSRTRRGETGHPLSESGIDTRRGRLQYLCHIEPGGGKPTTLYQNPVSTPGETFCNISVISNPEGGKPTTLYQNPVSTPGEAFYNISVISNPEGGNRPHSIRIRYRHQVRPFGISLSYRTRSGGNRPHTPSNGPCTICGWGPPHQNACTIVRGGSDHVPNVP